MVNQSHSHIPVVNQPHLHIPVVSQSHSHISVVNQPHSHISVVSQPLSPLWLQAQDAGHTGHSLLLLFPVLLKAAKVKVDSVRFRISLVQGFQ